MLAIVVGGAGVVALGVSTALAVAAKGTFDDSSHDCNGNRCNQHGLDLRSSAGLPTATGTWPFETMAQEDIPLAIQHICNATGSDKVDVVAHCMGASMFSMSLLGGMKGYGDSQASKDAQARIEHSRTEERLRSVRQRLAVEVREAHHRMARERARVADGREDVRRARALSGAAPGTGACPRRRWSYRNAGKTWKVPTDTCLPRGWLGCSKRPPA